MDMTLVQKIAVWALPVLFAITVHEAAHGYVARSLGDRTAESLGRLSLNPLKHIDPVGTVIVPLVLLVLGGFLFGWAKPVPVNFRNLRNPRRDMAIVAAAGPLSNLLMALAWGLLLRFSISVGDNSGIWIGLSSMAMAGILINLVLAVLNLLPLPPLDGGRVLAGLVSARAALMLDKVEPYGMLILIGLLATGALGWLISGPLALLQSLLLQLLGLR
ncbi:site-2 protease family protein [Sinimarinibacterium sp. CAU 1509]|uniref:site-2 protease family protein n=1 Tax=Sinimarinibacterium sp. CAU 1509 TaxID=2562283 RepID=UPI0010AD64B4|nr:site-2 protease family protein [Sinimarinibacterium sp. CAU 1509]TJY62195.1 site-2 protease family protein [Sinimarinibacterium sp. CAU 1509]